MTALVIRTAQDAIAAVPYLLGFHPSRSLVVIGYDGPQGTCAIRLDLPAPAAAGERVAALLSGNRFRKVLLLGYGPADEVDDSVGVMSAALTAAGLAVLESVRIGDGRWWSLTCTDGCCPAEGTPYDISSSLIAAQATLAGHVALADRAELVRSVQPLEGPDRESMRRATERAERRFLRWAREPAPRFRSRTTEEGLDHVPRVLSRSRAGIRPTDDDVAWLGFLLTDQRVRDEAWIRIDEDAPAADIAFWRDVLRRVEPPYVPAPASLLAYAAYSAGDGGLANVALERALEADPAYSMAVLLRGVIDAGIPPTKARMRMTPRQLATAYNEPDQEAS
ncbi:DUF4192 domain-containing protein [Actinomadura opuntiae]|uniref:DUF4192 domain-containing protein n=1 Tax=Actinomadura sp. OS1-43 TaxID=604315 RepID=UPI00255AD98D|nr:DUF4192 domain-containing protein [Actinomadura sp. OS1-43]MDL4815803.1 DUF4192 domain-containing protein [Actinomadura sp. OS1-43]